MSKTRFSVGQVVSNDDETGEITAVNLTRQGAVYEVVTNDEVVEMSEKDLMAVKGGAAIKASQLDSIWNGRQTMVLLQGCPAEQILSLTGQEFTDIRVTRKWFDQVKVGDVLPCHTSVKPEGFEPSEDTYPVKGALGYFNWQDRITDEAPEPAKWMLPKQPKPEPQGSLL